MTSRLRAGLALTLSTLIAALFPTLAQAQAASPAVAPAPFATQVWLNPGFYSIHFDRGKNLRDDNPGFGVEVDWARNHGAMAGSFINSRGARAHYLAYNWRPWHTQLWGMEVGAGVVLGALDGYPTYRNGNWFVVPLPVLSLEGRRFGVNLAVIPTLKDRIDGALTMQFKLRVW